jgi:hypothetical protein
VTATEDTAAIEEIVQQFFRAFASGPDVTARLEALPDLFLPGAVIVRTCGDEPVLYDVGAFITPRAALLTGGSLTDFAEWQLVGHTLVFGDLAHHVCTYAKSGNRDGVPFTAKGLKTMQLVRTSSGWRISAAAWDDERPGVTVPSALAMSEADRSLADPPAAVREEGEAAGELARCVDDQC